MMSILLFDYGLAQQQNHLNYGVVFRRAGKMATAMQRWAHTFELTIPDYKANPLRINQCNRDDHPNCMLRAMFTRVSNSLSEQLEGDVASSLEQARAIISTRLNVGPTSIAPDETTPASSDLGSRSKRALLPFVGDLASGLFGVATQGEIQSLAKHINKIYMYEKSLSLGQTAEAGIVNAYMNKTNKRITNAFKAVKFNHLDIQILKREMDNMGSDYSQMTVDIFKFIPILMNKIVQMVRIERQLESFLTGIHLLVQRQLSPSLVPEKVLKKALILAESTLRKRHPDFHVINHHPSFYYQAQDVMYVQSERSFFVTIQIPVSSRTALYTLYQVLTMPVPFNHTTTHATLVKGMPDYIAVTDDVTSYVEMSAASYDTCTNGVIKSCQSLSGERSMKTPSCAAAIFTNKTPKQYCEFQFLESHENPFILEIEPSVVLLSNIKEIIFTCRNDVTKRAGCTFCTVTLPCGCGLLADTWQIAPRLIACRESSESSKSFPVSLALLEQFFNQSALRKIESNTLFPEPLAFDIPHLQIEEPEFQKTVQQDEKLSRDLTDIVKSMKQSTKVSRRVISLTKEDLGMATEDFTTWPHIFATCALALSCVLAVAALVIFKRLRTLCIIVGMLTGGKGVTAATMPAPSAQLQWKNPNNNPMANPNASPGPELTYFNNAPPPPQPGMHIQPNDNPPIPDYALLIIELVSLILLLLVLLRFALAITRTMIYRSDVYLEISNGSTYIDVYLSSLALCPSEYELVLTSWVKKLALKTRNFAPDDLVIEWPNFNLKEKATSTLIGLPRLVKLTFYQCHSLRKMVKLNYTVNLKVVHGGRAFYVEMARSTWRSNRMKEGIANPTSCVPTAPDRFTNDNMFAVE